MGYEINSRGAELACRSARLMSAVALQAARRDAKAAFRVLGGGWDYCEISTSVSAFLGEGLYQVWYCKRIFHVAHTLNNRHTLKMSEVYASSTLKKRTILSTVRDCGKYLPMTWARICFVPDSVQPLRRSIGYRELTAFPSKIRPSSHAWNIYMMHYEVIVVSGRNAAGQGATRGVGMVVGV